jgi:hypothetical protein
MVQVTHNHTLFQNTNRIDDNDDVFASVSECKLVDESLSRRRRRRLFPRGRFASGLFGPTFRLVRRSLSRWSLFFFKEARWEAT